MLLLAGVIHLLGIFFTIFKYQCKVSVAELPLKSFICKWWHMPGSFKFMCSIWNPWSHSSTDQGKNSPLFKPSNTSHEMPCFKNGIIHDFLMIPWHHWSHYWEMNDLLIMTLHAKCCLRCLNKICTNQSLTWKINRMRWRQSNNKKYIKCSSIYEYWKWLILKKHPIHRKFVIINILGVDLKIL